MVNREGVFKSLDLHGRAVDDIEEDVVKDLLSILETCNFARFTPSTPDSINKDYQKAEDILSKITNSI